MEVNKKDVVLNFFEIISKIPRMSGHEEKIADYLESFARKRNLYCDRDKNNNIIIVKNASKGYENEDAIILQCHTDMVCEKLYGSIHDFLKDEIETYIEGDYIKARGTTLGADDGIGVAIILAILDDVTLEHPRIEAIFTTEEETTMNGAKNIDTKNLNGHKMICLDNMSEDELWTGCASHNVLEYNLDGLTKQKVDNEYNFIEIKLEGLLGGHSGIDIDKPRGNSIKIMTDIIRELKKETTILIKSITAEGKENVIPRECTSVIAMNKIDVEKILKRLGIIEESLRKSQLENAKNIKLDYTIKEEVDEAFDYKSTTQIIELISEIPNGVYYKENEKTLVSLNIGVIESKANNVKLIFSIRSNREQVLKEVMIKINKIKSKYNIEEKSSILLGYEHKGETEFIKKCTKLYKKNFNREPKLIDMHVGLEAGFFNSKIPKLDFVAIAPNIYNAHSPEERCSISSTQRVYKYLLDILKNK